MDDVTVTQADLELAEEIGMLWATQPFEVAAVQAGAVIARHRISNQHAPSDVVEALRAIPVESVVHVDMNGAEFVRGHERICKVPADLRERILAALKASGQ